MEKCHSAEKGVLSRKTHFKAENIHESERGTPTLNDFFRKEDSVQKM